MKPKRIWITALEEALALLTAVSWLTPEALAGDVGAVYDHLLCCVW